jgi:FMN-dependent NADH-azoreductase
MKVLKIVSSMTLNSARGSISTYALDQFVKFYKESNPSDEIIELNLNNEPMAQKTLNANNFNNFFNSEDTDHYIDQLKSVDKVIVATPMTNFNYTATLKNYLDHILVAKKSFLYKYDGKGTSEGLLKHLKVQIITTQGAPLGWYPFGNHTETLRGT